MTRSLQKLVHVGCRALGIDAESRRDLQLVVTGKESMADMTEAELARLVDALKAKGFRPSGGRRPRAGRADVRYAHVLWRLLHENGAAKVAGAEGLNAFIRARFAASWGHAPIDIDAMREWAEIADVIDALKAWCRRVGIDPDGGAP